MIDSTHSCDQAGGHNFNLQESRVGDHMKDEKRKEDPEMTREDGGQRPLRSTLKWNDTAPDRRDIDPRWVRVPVVAKMLSVSMRYVYKLVENGELPSVQLGRAICVPSDALYQWIADKEAAAQERTTHYGSKARSSESAR